MCSTKRSLEDGQVDKKSVIVFNQVLKFREKEQLSKSGRSDAEAKAFCSQVLAPLAGSSALMYFPSLCRTVSLKTPSLGSSPEKEVTWYFLKLLS